MPRKPPPPPAAPPLSSLGDLLRQRGVAVRDEAPAAVPPPATAPAPPPAGDLTGAGRLVVRRERKGHGGKTVTVVEGLAASPARLDELARAMRKALGCGSWAEGGRVFLQGDLADQAAAWLQRRGATRVVRGN
jgi:translation initiation factor 1